MFAIAAVIAFAISLILLVIDKSGNAAKLVLEFELAGLILLALHFCFGPRVWGPGPHQ
jgi:hypothetical protein